MKDNEQETAYEREQVTLARKEERQENYADGLLMSFIGSMPLYDDR